MRTAGVLEREELSFLYKLILEGYSDLDILNEYVCLNDSGKLTFPLRTDSSFVKDRRIEMETVIEVLKDNIQQIITPFIIKQREEHFTQVINISSALLDNNLSKVKRNELDSSRYITYNGSNTPIDLNKQQLLHLLRKNIENVYRHYTFDGFNRYYLPHLKAIMPEMESQGFWPKVEIEPYEVVTKIQELKKKEKLQGVCPICNNLENQLPPLLKSIGDIK